MKLKRAASILVVAGVAVSSGAATFAPAAATTAPAVTTKAATDITSASATLNGTVNPHGLATTVWFQVGSLTAYAGTTTTVTVPAGKTAVPVAIPLTGLAAGTAYRFQEVAQNSKGTKYAGPETFTAAAVLTVRPLNNDASAGKVVFTFDDGPSNSTSQLVTTLQALKLPAVFFDIGLNVQNNPAGMHTQQLAGPIENHSWDHPDFTGASLGTTPLTNAQATSELTKTSDAIVAAGAPKPTMWRPPYGDVNNNFNTLANNLGFRLVMPYGNPSGGNIVDSNDWNGLTAAQICTDVTQGYTAPWYTGPQFFHGIQADTIIAMHDDGNPATIASLQCIVDYMNANHLGATSTVRQDATGGVLAFTDVAASGAKSKNLAKSGS